jgi:hypothetical protein
LEFALVVLVGDGEFVSWGESMNNGGISETDMDIITKEGLVHK